MGGTHTSPLPPRSSPRSRPIEPCETIGPIAMQKLPSRLRTSFALVLVGSWIAAIAVACSDDTPEEAGPSTESEAGANDSATPPERDAASSDAAVPPSPKAVCEAYVSALCARSVECNRAINCDRMLAACPDTLFAPGSTRTLDDVIACTPLVRAQSCAEVSGRIEVSCDKPGTRKKGEACAFDNQCESYACAGSDGTCGSCLGLLPQGAPCANAPGFSCGLNTACYSDGGCTPRAAQPTLSPGDSCPERGADARQCPIDAPCASKTPNSDAGTCITAPSTGACLFERLQPYSTLCLGGTACTYVDAAAPDGICVTGAPLGYACGGSFPDCAPGGYCTEPTFGGVCAAMKKVGEACTGNRPPCVPGSYCQMTGANTGICTAGVKYGEPCGPSTDSGAVACSEGQCAYTADAGDARCVHEPATNLQPCDLPLSPCHDGLECRSDHLCHLPDCVADGGAR